MYVIKVMYVLNHNTLHLDQLSYVKRQIKIIFDDDENDEKINKKNYFISFYLKLFHFNYAYLYLNADYLIAIYKIK